MSLRSQLEQRKMAFTLIVSFIALAVSTSITLAIIPVAQPVHPHDTLLGSVFATNSEASARSTIYIFTFKAATASSINAIEITVPNSYDIKGAGYISGSDGFKFSSFKISDSKMKVVFQEPIHLPAGSMSIFQIGGINNPSMPGLHTFTIATIDSGGTIVNSGAASVTIEEPTILRNSIQTEHIQDGAITAAKMADGSINLSKLADEAFSFFGDQFSFLQEQITEQINALQTELEASIRSEESARVAADNNESLVRGAEDENIREEIDELRQQIESLEEEIDELS